MGEGVTLGTTASGLCGATYSLMAEHHCQIIRDVAAATREANARGEGFKADSEKPDWSLLPWGPVEDVVRVLTVGARKYAPANWQKVPDARRRYFSAAVRHLVAWERGELADPETHLPHLAHATCCLLFAAWFDRAAPKSEGSQ